MKQALLYNPKEKRNIINPVLPFSLMTVATVWKKEGYKVKIIDGRLGDRIEDHLNPNIEKVGITSMTGSTIQNAIQASKIVKEYDNGIKVIWGGFHASLLPEQTLKNPYIDEVFQSRYDTSYIDYSTVDLNRYIRNEGGLKTIDVLSSSGCPYRCAYCAISKVYGRKWIPFNLDNHFLPLITVLYEKYGVRKLHIMDDNFFIDSKRVEKICDYIISHNYKLKIWGMCRTNIFRKFDHSTLHKLKKAGFDTINFGAESGSPRILKYIQKDITIHDTIETARICKRFGFNAEYSFMIGFPSETEKDVESTLNLIDELTSIIDCDIKLFMFCPFPGTPLYEDALQHGLEEPKSLEAWTEFEYENVITPWVPDHIKKIFDKATYVIWFAFTPTMEQKFSKWWQRIGYKILKQDARFRWRTKRFGFAPEWWLVKKIARG